MDDHWDGLYYKKHGNFQRKAALSTLKRCTFKGDEHVLDIGCGSGAISKWIADKVPKGRVIGTDLSQSMVAQAVRDFRKTSNLTFLCQTAENTSFQELFHLVTSFHALHFVASQQLVLEKIYRALLPGGRVLIRMVSEFPTDVDEIFARKKWRDFPPFRKKLFPLAKEEGEELLQKAGFLEREVVEELTVYSFFLEEEIVRWLMTWIRHPSGFSQEQALEFATEFAQNSFSKKEFPVVISMKHLVLSGIKDKR